ncbi:MAG: hypothetical protein GY710_22460 [Desulfobacteraceae bacterium]|nr:hypothetical protein [Desulfobacteraceae bacterium]
MKISNNFKKYIFSIGILGIAAVLSQFAPAVYHFWAKSPEGGLTEIFFIVAVVFILSTASFYSSQALKLPSFVLAIAFGLAAKPVLNPIVIHGNALSIIVSMGATFILFGGGLETPFTNFKRLIYKICSLSFLGLFLTAWMFSQTTYYLSIWFGQPLSMHTAVVLGALLASTDPAAIIPLFKNLRFKNHFVKNLVISESAVTDVVGTLLTVVFLSVITSGSEYNSINHWYTSIFSIPSGMLLGKQIIFGVGAGLFGFVLLKILRNRKNTEEEEFEADSAYFLFVPVFIFTIALSVGGSGYLAAFIAGLVFSLNEKMRATEKFFNFLVEGFFKPSVFIFLGALVDVHALISYAGIGLLSALIFMLIIRPIAVFVSLYFWTFAGKDRLSVKDLIFISFVRETGAIPAVLLTTVIGMGIVGVDGLVEIGMWVILSTLIIEPIFTPWIATKLGVAEEMEDENQIDIPSGIIAVLGSRGNSFVNRLPFVAEWTSRNLRLRQVVLLCCLEDKYNLEKENEILLLAQKEFSCVNKMLVNKNLQEVSFMVSCRQGLLHDNLKHIGKEKADKTIIFIGKRMLDFRLGEIKSLGVPVYFLE